MQENNLSLVVRKLHDDIEDLETRILGLTGIVEEDTIQELLELLAPVYEAEIFIRGYAAKDLDNHVK
ncbi:hypothetical protein P70_0025 [Listeria phage P70]|uniref:Uncharacterized protein n=1 Tax=Listeria phage P70 TaxID=1225800 RepID=J9QSL3_9CAUD|nr:hypothetical protein P70_0025 [Listeria phage P70]AFQ96214.1 hypothetical protein P70_0025 [Listeria phage P70]